MGMPKASEAVGKEWGKLGEKRAWDVNTVRERRDASAAAEKYQKQLHVGSLMDLCHGRHSELHPYRRGYKGGVVFGIPKTSDGTNQEQHEMCQSGPPFSRASKVLHPLPKS